MKMLRRMSTALLMLFVSLSATAAELRLLPLGDSITGEPRAYRLALYQALTEANFNQGQWRFVGTQTEQYPSDGTSSLPPQQLQHEGYPGITIGGLAAKVDAALDATQPDIVLLQIGANDLAAWQSAPVDELVQQYVALVKQILKHDDRVRVLAGAMTAMSPQVVEPFGEDRAENVERFNRKLEKALQPLAKKGRVQWVPHSLTADDLRDGLHPGDEGYRKFARDFAAALTAS